MPGLGSPTEELRHPAEIPLLISGTIVFIGLLVAAAFLLNATFGMEGIVALLATIFVLYVARGMINASERANSVQITPEQFAQEVDTSIEQYLASR